MKPVQRNRPKFHLILFHGQTILFFISLLLLPYSNSPAQESGINIDSLISLAEHRLANGEIDSARESFNTALDFDKKESRALLGLGETYFAEKDWRAARDIFTKVLKAVPASLEAHYYAGICDRELGKTRAWFLRAADWRNARKHFQMVTAADSLFKDVLYQYSLLEEYDEEFPHALELAHAQLRLRQDLVEPKVSLFNLYHHFIFVADTETSLAWLRSHPSSYARYFTGELLRAGERPDDARIIYEDMLQTDSLFSRQALLLSLVRVKIAEGDIPEAERLYWQAVEGVHTPLGAGLVFEDMKYIMSDEELRMYNGLSTLERKRSFFHAFWNIRNPIAASRANARLIEHYRRMVYAEQNYSYYGFHIKFNSADKSTALRFPESYSLNQRFSDKGLIYVRHGPPNEIERAAGIEMTDLHVDDNLMRDFFTHESRDSSLSKWSDPNESWLYFETSESPRWIFNFVLADGNWRLAPLPTDRRMFGALASWDPRFGRLSSKVALEQLNTSETLIDASRENVTLALSTDEHDWDRRTQRFHVPCSVDAFRSDGGRSLLNISYGIPMPVIARLLPPNVFQVKCEVGISLTNLNSQSIANKLDTIVFPISRTSSGFVTSLFRYVVKPDSYAISLSVHPLGVDALGIWSNHARVRDFSSGNFLISDLEFLMPSNSSSSIEINGMKVIQVPFTVYQPKNPLYVYYQIYNLAADNNGGTSFTTEYFLTPRGGDGHIPLLKLDREGSEESSGEFATLNLKAVKPGKYLLSVRVTDRNRSGLYERSRLIELVDE